MSSYDQGQKFPELGIVPGNREYLSPDARIWLKQLLRFPEDLPEEFWSAIDERVKVNARITRGQVEGLTQFNAISSGVAAFESTTSSTFVDLATVGPQIAGLSDGRYVFLFSAIAQSLSAGNAAFVGLSINGAVPGPVAIAEIGVAFQNLTVATSTEPITLSNGNNNSVKMQYRGNNTGLTTSYQVRSLLAFKVSN